MSSNKTTSGHKNLRTASVLTVGSAVVLFATFFTNGKSIGNSEWFPGMSVHAPKEAAPADTAGAKPALARQ